MKKTTINITDKKPTSINTLTLIQNELKVPKTHYSEFGNYYYRNCDDIMEAIKPLLKKYNATLTITDKVGSVIDKVMYIESTCHYRDSQQKIEISAQAGITPEKKKFDISQLFGTASSYASKYALNKLFLLDDTKDADATKDAENTVFKDKKENEIKVGDTVKQTNKNETPETLDQLRKSAKSHFTNAVKNKKISEKDKQKYDEFMANIETHSPFAIKGFRTALKKLING